MTKNCAMHATAALSEPSCPCTDDSKSRCNTPALTTPSPETVEEDEAKAKVKKAQKVSQKEPTGFQILRIENACRRCFLLPFPACHKVKCLPLPQKQRVRSICSRFDKSCCFWCSQESQGRAQGQERESPQGVEPHV